MSSFVATTFQYCETALVFLVMISVLVAAHELGHYLFARLFGMGVEEFAIGFGKPVLWTWMRRTYRVKNVREADAEPITETTDFTVRPLPLGGFVRIKGMVPEDDGTEINIPGGFYNKPPWQRLIVLFAGPVFSVLAGILILIPLYATVGVDRYNNDPIVQNVVASEAVSKILKPGDRIVAINGEPIHTFFDYLVRVRNAGGKTFTFDIDRAGKAIRVAITPRWFDVDTPVLDENLEPTGELRRQSIVGIAFPGTKTVRLPLGEAVLAAFMEPVKAVRSVAGLFKKPKNFNQAVSGPATMVGATNMAVQQGLSRVFWLSAVLSISVGIFNLLPFHPLDGGQMVIAFAELIRGGKRMSVRFQTVVGGVGAMLIVALVLSAWFVDFKRFLSPEPDKPLKFISPHNADGTEIPKSNK